MAGKSINGVSEAAAKENPVVTIRGAIRCLERMLEDSLCPTVSASQRHLWFWYSIETTRSYMQRIISPFYPSE